MCAVLPADGPIVVIFPIWLTIAQKTDLMQKLYLYALLAENINYLKINNLKTTAFIQIIILFLHKSILFMKLNIKLFDVFNPHSQIHDLF